MTEAKVVVVSMPYTIVLGYVFLCVFLRPKIISAIMNIRPIIIPYCPKNFENIDQIIAVKNAPKKNIEIFESMLVDLP